MNELRQSLEREGRSRFAFLRQPSVARWAAVPLRVIVGYGFMEHGFAKLSKGPEVFAGILHAIGVPAPHFMAWVTILTEIIGGLAVLLGAFVPLVSLPMAGLLFVAMISGPSALWIQFDQAWSAGNRVCSFAEWCCSLHTMPVWSPLPVPHWNKFIFTLV